MRMHHFSLVLSGLREMTDEAANALYEAGCDDCLPGSCDGVSMCHFHREAASLDEAIRSAVTDVRKAGFAPERVEIEREDLEELVKAAVSEEVRKKGAPV